jgi:hypothetical protein
MLLLVTVLVSSGGCQSSFFYNCNEGGEIDPEKRSTIAAASVQFTQAALAGDAEAVYSTLTDAAKANASRDQLIGVLQDFKGAGTFSDFKIERIMTLTGRGDTSKSNGHADCTKDATHPEAHLMLTIEKVPEQAYVLVSAKNSNSNSKGYSSETWITTLWLIPRAGKWQVNGFHAVMATLLSRPVDEYLARARRENGRGHTLNASTLYFDAASLAARGPFYHTGMEDLIQQESQQVTQPQEFRGPPPFSLAGPSGSFSIVRMITTQMNGKLYLVIVHEVDPWKDSKEVERKNKVLIQAFAKRFPEYSDIFGGIVAQAAARGSDKGWNTVEDNASIQSSVANRK